MLRRIALFTISKIQIFFIMPTNPKSAPTAKQTLSFAFCGSISILMLARNSLRLRSYLSTFKEVTLSMQKFRNNLNELQRIRENNSKEKTFLETVFPSFPINYFKNVENPLLYTTKVAKFYEGLECEQSFEGVLRQRGKQYPITFQMHKPSVGFQLADNARKFDAQGIRFHRNQMITAYGGLSYNREMKRYVMKTELIGLDTIEILKFFQLKLIATIISTFYFAFLLGIAISMTAKLDLWQFFKTNIDLFLPQKQAYQNNESP